MKIRGRAPAIKAEAEKEGLKGDDLKMAVADRVSLLRDINNLRVNLRRPERKPVPQASSITRIAMPQVHGVSLTLLRPALPLHTTSEPRKAER
jgi:hypothetical protein